MSKKSETASSLKKVTSVEFPQKDESYERPVHDNSEYNVFSAFANNRNADSYSLSEEEFNPHNVAGSPPNAFISTLKQRMGCYYME